MQSESFGGLVLPGDGTQVDLRLELSQQFTREEVDDIGLLRNRSQRPSKTIRVLLDVTDGAEILPRSGLEGVPSQVLIKARRLQRTERRNYLRYQDAIACRRRRLRD